MSLVVMMCLVSFIGIETIPLPATVGQNAAPQGLDDEPVDDSAGSEPTGRNSVIDNANRGPVSTYSEAEESGSGHLLPLTVEQLGFSFTSPTVARTDSMVNLDSSLDIDTAHDWRASRADLSLWDLTRMYAVNGSFDEGIPGTNEYPTGDAIYHPYGWDSTSYTPDTTTTQRSQYKAVDRRYVVLEDEGKSIGTGSNLRFQHAGGTYITWTQQVANAPYTDEFILSLDYMYLRGPLGADLGNITLAVMINQTRVWYVNLDDVAMREEWYGSGEVPVSVPGVGSSFNLTVELRVETTITAYPSDIGFIHAYYMTAYVDDVVLTGIAPPAFDEVALTFHAGSQATTVQGLSGTGDASISNTSYWTDASLQFRVLSNSSVAFSYRVCLLNHRFLNSSYAADNAKVGTAYSMSSGKSAHLTLYTYLGSLEGYENYTIRVHKPKDWVNTTVLDPSLYDTTFQCNLFAEVVEITTSALDNLGWWQVRFEAPNYLKSASVQRFDSGLSQWFDASTLRTGNTTRTKVGLGTSTETPDGPYTVNLVWKVPNGSAWVNETVVGGEAGEAYSQNRVLDSSGAGVWTVTIQWTNGTEVAFGTTVFVMLHQTSLVPVNSFIQTDAGLTVAVRVYYVDTETDQYILSLGTAITANWSTTISLLPNAENNWWSAQLDTSLLPVGSHTVVAVASHPYFDSASCAVQVISTAVTRLNSPNAPWTSSEWNSTQHLVFHYEAMNQSTLIWGPVDNVSGGVWCVANWTDGAWSVTQTPTPGIYDIAIDTGVRPSGTYLLNMTFGRPDYQAQQMLLTMIVSQTASSLSIAGPVSAKVEVGEAYILKLRYENDIGFPITGASVALEEVLPPGGLGTTAVLEVPEEPGNYTLTLTVLEPGVYTLRFMATEGNSEPAVSVFVILTDDLGTNMLLLTNETVGIGVDESHEAIVGYYLNNGTGVEGASIQVVYSGPTGGLTWTSPVDIGAGQYSISLTPVLLGTYVVTVIASKAFYETSSKSLVMVTDDLAADMLLLTDENVGMALGESHLAIVEYNLQNGTGIENAAIQVVFSGRDGGLTWSSPVEIGGGQYSVNFTAVLSGTYVITIAASKAYHEPSSRSFAVSTDDIVTDLLLLTEESVGLGLGESHLAIVEYNLQNGTGIENASIQVVYSGPDGGLTYGSPTEIGSGQYSVSFTPVLSGTYVITITGSKTYHETSITSFFLLVGEIAASLTLLNVSPAFIGFGEQYRLVVHYSNASGYGLEGALVQVASVNPPAGLDIGSVVNESDGYYSLVLQAAHTGTYSILVAAGLTNHQTGLVTLTLTITDIPTFLTAEAADESISLDRNATIVLHYRTLSAVGLPGANLTLVDPPGGVNYAAIHDDGNGTYSIAIIPVETGVFNFVFRADLANHQRAYAALTLTVVLVPTSLRTSDGVYAASTEFGQELAVSLVYERTDIASNISSAAIDVHVYPSADINWTVVEDAGRYVVLIRSHSLGHFSLAFTAERDGHSSATITFTLDVVEIDTYVVEPRIDSDLHMGRAYSLIVGYRVYSNNSAITNARIRISGLGLELVDYTETDDGLYNLTVTPSGQGSWTVTIALERVGFVSGISEVSFEVTRVPVAVTLLSKPFAIEGASFEISVKVAEADTMAAVTGARVEFRISSGESGEFLPMTETGAAGIYVATYVLAAWDDVTNYTLEITFDKDNYALVNRFLVDFYKEPDALARAMPVAVTGGSSIVLLVALVGGAQYLQRRRRRINLNALASKKRFEDISNLIGIIVIHRDSGITVYSKMLRGGFEEAMIGAFVSAITHFRQEFQMEGSHWDFEVLPISDVISAVPTKSLICAFITATKPSLSQETKMEAYGRATGAMFDDMFSEEVPHSLDQETTDLFEGLFVNVMDGFLLKPFKKVQNGGYPRKMKCLVRTVEHLDAESGFTLDQLVKGMSACGIEETHAYMMIEEAIEEDLIETKEASDKPKPSAFIDSTT